MPSKREFRNPTVAVRRAKQAALSSVEAIGEATSEALESVYVEVQEMADRAEDLEYILSEAAEMMKEALKTMGKKCGQCKILDEKCLKCRMTYFVKDWE